jgi:hypothetical protein
MNTVLLQRISFIGKSLLWSLLLYAITIAILDWNEVVIAFTGDKKTTEQLAGSPGSATTPAKISSNTNKDEEISLPALLHVNGVMKIVNGL